MTEWIVTSCVLIAVVLGIRFLLKNRISGRLRYGLWLLVLIRLLIPFSLPSDMSVMNLLPEKTPEQVTVGYVDYELPDIAVAEPNPDLPPDLWQAIYEDNLQEYNQQIQQAKADTGTPVTLGSVLIAVWVVGIAATGCVLLICNCRFALRLRANRERLDISDAPLPVYITDCVQTPCLFGIFQPAIYLTPELSDQQTLRHVLLHELTHRRHLDHIWSALRCVCLALHWYNPLVWVAAVFSKQDAEVACDEAVIRQLGEDQRASYGKTLIDMTCAGQAGKGLLLAATTMVSGKKALKERVIRIARNPKTKWYALVAVILAASVAVGCTFTGTPTLIDETTTDPTQAQPQTPTETTTEPSTPTELEATKPTDSPEKPTNPTNSTESVDPTESSKPTKPTEPSQNDSIQSTEPQNPEKVILQGKCPGSFGDWKITADGTLTIFGSTRMEDSQIYPWTKHSDKITKVVVDNGMKTIAERAFQGLTNVTSIWVADSVTEIRSSAFGNCTSLKSVRLSNNITKIPRSLFGGCSSLTQISFPDSNKITEIEAYAFFNSGLKEFVAPNGLKIIKADAFHECPKLETVILTGTVEELEASAFEKCGNLRKLVIGENVKKISYHAFTDTIGIRHYESYASVNIDINRQTRLQTLILGGNLESLPSLLGLKYLTSVTITSSYTSIPNAALSSCSSITTFEISDAVTSIGGHAFRGTSLEKIKLPDKLKTIGPSAFAETKLKKITIPASVTSLGDSVFCDSTLTEITFLGDLPSISSMRAFGGLGHITVYYPANNSTWTEAALQNYGAESVTWIAQ